MLLNPSAKISMEKEVEKIRFSEIGGSPELIKILSDHLKSRDVSFNFLESAEGLETMEMVEFSSRYVFFRYVFFPVNFSPSKYLPSFLVVLASRD